MKMWLETIAGCVGSVVIEKDTFWSSRGGVDKKNVDNLDKSS